ncbi:DJ-1/PfpI family protein [Bacillus sp. FJAT-27225]|uniref:DJ-1/PfpI family protein n=1 Tax=Bacillus sp. FJAT-27225 TaxID=1743144 RepID=UPI000980FD54
MSIENTPCISEAGLTVVPDLTIREVSNDDYDVLIIPGGDLKPIAQKEELFSWVKNFVGEGKIAAAIAVAYLCWPRLTSCTMFRIP